MGKIFIIPGIILAITPQSLMINVVGVIMVLIATAYEYKL